MMSRIWGNQDIRKFFRRFGTACLWYESRLSPQLRQGLTDLGADTIYGRKYNDPVDVRLMRSTINYRIVYAADGRIYEGGARFTIPPVVYVGKDTKRLEIYDRIFMGDVIVVKTKPIRDFDILRRGYRDTLFAFDVGEILSVVSTNVRGVETIHQYGVDYNLSVNGKTAVARVREDGTISITQTKTVPIVSELTVNWLNQTGAKKPTEGAEYAVEFLCSPNYVVWDNLANIRATEENDLPKSVLCVRRAFFNQIQNPVDSVNKQQAVFGKKPQILDDDKPGSDQSTPFILDEDVLDEKPIGG